MNVVKPNANAQKMRKKTPTEATTKLELLELASSGSRIINLFLVSIWKYSATTRNK